MVSFPTLASLLCLVLLPTISSPATASFTCTSPGTCDAIIDYTLPNATSFNALKKLFNLKNLRSLLGVNNLPVDIPPNQELPANHTIKIPFPCLCRNGTGIANKRPTYTVIAGDFLSHIVSDIFGGLFTVQELQAVNNISNPDLIQPGDKLWIPLPCSCDDVEGEKVVHYGRLVTAGSTIDDIAQQYNVSQDTLLRLNRLASPRELLAGSVLDVPLKACQSMVSNTSLDYPLLVPNDTYIFTAANCVKCKCDAANNWALQCQPSQIKSSLWKTCPSMQCQGLDNFYIGNVTSSDCNSTACTYAGYSNQTIFTASTPLTCPADGNSASGLRTWTWRWNIILAAIHLVLLSASYLR
ncbi:lysM domain-containing GPI-anchored protein 2 [Lycium barbarum]|uniref:lysM domain-containing GPI-anchored protein 2 n=1 Tax=Lycium barbarum TaxID=112863 RepID=UPI00293EE49C|nr:lysM domain-containing GPI-anchored protein 2 [Lycium barbarum]